MTRSINCFACVTICTSDLSVKIEGYYFPINFDRYEPNIILPPSGSNEEALWNQREAFVQEFLCEELKLDKFASFRDLTQEIFKAYEQNPDFWHQRLRPGRIWGIITTAIEKFQVTEVYCFVTDQSEEEKSGRLKDTIYLFNILQKWLKKEIPDLTLHSEIIKTKAVEQDALFNLYYKFFSRVSPGQNKILISIKGGTGQMQTALRIQAMASMVEFQANLEPELNIIKVLNGEPSSCKLNAYWQYIRSQKYQAINKLLQRWDFDGSIQLLQDWQRYLQILIQENIADSNVNNSQVKIEQIIAALEIAVDCFNLDNFKASQDLKRPESHPFRKLLFNLVADNNYDRLLNLYTQCRIYWELNQIANFLSRLASFCEETLHDLIQGLEGLQYFDKVNYPDDWFLNKSKVETDLWKQFEKNEGSKCNNKFPYRLPGRFSKRNFVNALIQYRGNLKEKTAWQKITESLTKLDYWIEKRNEIVHSAKGVSLESMQKSLARDKKNLNKDEQFASVACEPDEILVEITNISNQTSWMLNQPKNKFVGLNNTSYYIYSDIRDWVVSQLIETRNLLHSSANLC
ncbi:hypothetical protein F7734_25035 [Scytonema sp. UIC 10036]|uniref:hypothetical protein n=1 Tax=Scytonema sp. UIC 10036 TaxID=2304196 RepID=UPI0012DA5EE0|nr:hypothetical protein [Scytonema sp. UIC 10036]MUG95449.1 hypothetical protein [Scytonema sp. UIC 10036]